MISMCPICAYSLLGLPDDHRCPECGFEFQRDTIVVEQARVAIRSGAIVNPILFGAAVIGWLMGRIVLPLVGLFATLLAVSLWRLRTPKMVFLVSSRELQLLRRGRVWARYPMTNIRDAEYSWITGEVTVMACNGPPVAVRIPYGFLLSGKRAKRLVCAINEYARGGKGVGS